MHGGIPPPRDQASPPNRPPLGPGTPPGADPPGPGIPPPPGADPRDQAPPQEQSMLGDTVNERAVRILLECILVEIIFTFSSDDR